MATTAVTKQHIADTLRALTKQQPFAQITVAALCDHSGISRKTFYYHFKDRHDLLAWLFEREVMTRILTAAPEKYWDFYAILANYLYENRSFYYNILSGRDGAYLLQIFKDFMRRHFSRYICPEYLAHVADEKRGECIDFLCTTFAASLEEWLRNRPHLSPQEYLVLARFDKILD